jgi:outer membrane biosynthesis protein TonB
MDPEDFWYQPPDTHYLDQLDVPGWWQVRARWARLPNPYRLNTVLYLLGVLSLGVLVLELTVGGRAPTLDVASRRSVAPTTTSSTMVVAARPTGPTRAAGPTSTAAPAPTSTTTTPTTTAPSPRPVPTAAPEPEESQDPDDPEEPADVDPSPSSTPTAEPTTTTTAAGDFTTSSPDTIDRRTLDSRPRDTPPSFPDPRRR